ncbi:MAG: TlpA disulfide reductase family protein [Dehalococcoidia bacterium]
MASRMSKRTWLILAIVIIAVGAIVGIAMSRNSPSPSDSTPQSDEAPDFTLPTMTGANITLSELEGTPVVLLFWATWCPHCPTELHRLEAVAQQTEGEIKVIAISIDISTSMVQTFFGDYKPTMTIALDSNGEVFTDYCLPYNNIRGSIPFALFVDNKGIVKYVKIGAFTSDEQLQEALSSIS